MIVAFKINMKRINDNVRKWKIKLQHHTISLRQKENDSATNVNLWWMMSMNFSLE